MERQIHPAQTKISEAAFQESDRIHPVTSNDEDNGSLQEAQQHPAQRRSCRDFKNIVRVGVIGAVLLIVVAVTVDAFTDKRLETAFSSFVDWVAHHPVRGTFAVILVYIAATVCFVPGSVLTVATGYAFGQAFPRHTFWAVILSSVAVFLGASVGSLMCLLLGRYLFREPVMRLAERYPIFRAVDRALEQNGFKIMLLLRLSPLVPYNALDYVSGVTSISIPHYCQALVGLLPGTVTLCYIGGTASSLTSGKSAVTEIRTIAMIVGIVFAAAGAGVASYYSKIELDKMLAEQRDENDEMESIPQPLMMSDTLILEPALMDAAAGRQSSGHDSASYHAIPRSMYTDGLDNP